MDINQCDPIVLKTKPPSCYLIKDNLDCKLIDLINQQSCIGAAVQVINKNFSTISSFLEEITKNTEDWTDTINQITRLHSRWEEAYNIYCNSNWPVEAINLTLPPLQVFYPSIYDYNTWTGYTSIEKSTEINGPISRWINKLYPAAEYSANAQLNCTILLKRMQTLLVRDGGSSICPADGLLGDSYVVSSEDLLFTIKDKDFPQWEF